MLPRSRLDDSAHVQHHYHLLAPCTVRTAQVFDELLFGIPKLEVPLEDAVLPFTCLTAEHQNGHVVHTGLVIDGGGGEGQFLAVFPVFDEFLIVAGLDGL